MMEISGKRWGRWAAAQTCSGTASPNPFFASRRLQEALLSGGAEPRPYIKDFGFSDLLMQHRVQGREVPGGFKGVMGFLGELREEIQIPPLLPQASAERVPRRRQKQ